MSRTDVPTLMCDRCKTTTQDLSEMGRYAKLRHGHMEGMTEWDLCPTCWGEFTTFVEGATS